MQGFALQLQSIPEQATNISWEGLEFTASLRTKVVEVECRTDVLHKILDRCKAALVQNVAPSPWRKLAKSKSDEQVEEKNSFAYDMNMTDA